MNSDLRHDIKNHLTVILSFTQLVDQIITNESNNDITTVTQQAKDLLAKIQKRVKTTAELMDQTDSTKN